MTNITDWINPWAANRRLRARLALARAECGALEHALQQSADRYDRVRDANAQLRLALALYRDRNRDTSGPD